MIPESLTLQQAQGAFTENTTEAGHWKHTLAMLGGDHWLGGLAWVGPRLPDTNPLAGEFLLNVQRQFMAKNATKEVAMRHVGAVVGRYPVIKLALRDAAATPTSEQQAEMKVGEGALTRWLDRVRALGKLQRFTLLLLLGKAHLQNYVPSGQLIQGRIPPGDLITSIQRIRLRVPEPGTAEVIDDEETGQRYALYRSQTKTGQDAVEITYLTGDGTVVRRVETGAAQLVDVAGDLLLTESRSASLDLHGLLTITEAVRDQFLTPTLIRNNWMLNFAKTAILRNAELAAILERYGIGILPPGKYVADNTVPGGMRFEPEAGWTPGGATATFFPPQTIVDDSGAARMANSGQYGRFEPVSPDSLIATKVDAYHDMLDEAGQGHIKADTTGPNSSGEARIQAMNDFKASLYATATCIESALADHLEMTLAWAAVLSGQPGRFRDYRVVVQCRILAAQPTVQERAQVIQEKDAGLRSTENAMSEIGIEDTDQMLAAVKEERAEAATQAAAAAKSLAALMGDPPGGGA